MNLNLIPIKDSMLDELRTHEFSEFEPCESACRDCPHYEFTYIPATREYPAEGEQFCRGAANVCPRAEKAVQAKSGLFDEVWWENLAEYPAEHLAYAITGTVNDLRDLVRLIWRDISE